jgi:hypothetical protein
MPIFFTLSIKLEKIITLIEQLDWKEARKICIFDVLKMADGIFSNKNIRSLSLFGTELNMVINPFYCFMELVYQLKLIFNLGAKIQYKSCIVL